MRGRVTVLRQRRSSTISSLPRTTTTRWRLSKKMHSSNRFPSIIAAVVTSELVPRALKSPVRMVTIICVWRASHCANHFGFFISNSSWIGDFHFRLQKRICSVSWLVLIFCIQNAGWCIQESQDMPFTF